MILEVDQCPNRFVWPMSKSGCVAYHLIPNLTYTYLLILITIDAYGKSLCVLTLIWFKKWANAQSGTCDLFFDGLLGMCVLIDALNK